MQKWLDLITRLNSVDTERLLKLLTALNKDMKDGLTITRREIWLRAATIDGEPRCPSYELFDAVNFIAEFLKE